MTIVPRAVVRSSGTHWCTCPGRTTEPDRRTRREAYPVEFRMTPADIETAPEVPVVPPLRVG